MRREHLDEGGSEVVEMRRREMMGMGMMAVMMVKMEMGMVAEEMEGVTIQY